jgi:hypothetical protein
MVTRTPDVCRDRPSPVSAATDFGEPVTTVLTEYTQILDGTL